MDEVAGGLDFYTCGFPCQPYSMAGIMKGMLDKRGHILPATLSYISEKKPRGFVLENVDNIVKFEEVFTFLIEYLRALDRFDKTMLVKQRC
jgi:DNA (cytosine-5)-methyltransferase 1